MQQEKLKLRTNLPGIGFLFWLARALIDFNSTTLDKIVSTSQ